jgi:hypothetical protein
VVNRNVIAPPLEIIQSAFELNTPAADQDANADFGASFPGLIESPLVTELPSLEDPVASGGDSSLYLDVRTEGEDASDREEAGEETDNEE